MSRAGCVGLAEVWTGSKFSRVVVGQVSLKYLGGHPGGRREVGYGTLGYRAVPIPGFTAVRELSSESCVTGRLSCRVEESRVLASWGLPRCEPGRYQLGSRGDRRVEELGILPGGPGGRTWNTRVPARPHAGRTVVLVLGVHTLIMWGSRGPLGSDRGGSRPSRARLGEAKRAELRWPRGKVVPVHVRVQESRSGPDGHPAGMGVPHRVERQ